MKFSKNFKREVLGRNYDLYIHLNASYYVVRLVRTIN
jgi:hypothetical protein